MQRRKRIEIRGAIISAAAALLLFIWAAARELVYITATSAIMEYTSLWIIALQMMSRKAERRQKVAAGFIPAAMLPVSAVLAAFSIMQLDTACLYTSLDYIPALVLTMIYVISVLPVSIHKRRNLDIASWGGREVSFDALAISLSAAVNLMLNTAENPENGMMTALTGGLMAFFILLVSVNIGLCASFGFQSTGESIRELRAQYRKKQRAFHFIAVGKDCVMVLIKVALSIISSSFFMFANALFSSGIAVARYEALKMKGQERKSQLKKAVKVSAVIIFSGLCYVCYSVRLFFGGSSADYGMVMALAIACYTFADFTIQIMELIRLRKAGSLEAEALRVVSLCSILVCFVLTQTAIMSFSSGGAHHISDGLGGVVFGSLVTGAGAVYLVINHLRYAEIASKHD